MPSTRRTKSLDINLLKVVHPERRHIAATQFSYTELRSALVEAHGNPPIDWILHGKRISREPAETVDREPERRAVADKVDCSLPTFLLG